MEFATCHETFTARNLSWLQEDRVASDLTVMQHPRAKSRHELQPCRMLCRQPGFGPTSTNLVDSDRNPQQSRYCTRNSNNLKEKNTYYFRCCLLKRSSSLQYNLHRSSHPSSRPFTLSYPSSLSMTPLTCPPPSILDPSISMIGRICFCE